ncbi:hypothetical protein M3Y97_00736800 [Aphelenchoides bicaudatus]|nr:hypothetical protein M3Y97_00736800 [Aphelenchoides bicaudatus]
MNWLTGHICDRPHRISRLSCCHFVFLLNDSRIPLCEEMSGDDNSTKTVTFAPRPTNTYSTPAYLSLPHDVPEDHITFLFGIILLISVAVFCAVVIMKLTKPNLLIDAKCSRLGFARLPSSLSFPTSLDYDLFLWLPRHSQRRSSLMLFLRSVACRSDRTRRQTSLSVVSNSSFGLLPSYRSAASTTTISPNSILPPPAYDELMESSQLTASTYVPSDCTSMSSANRLIGVRPYSDRNNNRRR